MKNPLRRNANERGGLSFLEVVGCIAALIGGVVLGSMYLGIDLVTTTVGAIEDSGLVPADDTAVGQKFAEMKVALGVEDKDASEDSAEVAGEDGAAAASGDDGEQPDNTAAAKHESETIVYWGRVGAALTAEAASRSAALDAKDSWQLFDYLTRRKDGHEQAAEALDQLDSDDVEDRVVEFAARYQHWHEQGAALFGQALGLLSESSGSELTGPMAQSWKSAQTQHRMEERLLIERRQALEGYLQHLRTAR